MGAAAEIRPGAREQGRGVEQELRWVGFSVLRRTQVQVEPGGAAEGREGFWEGSSSRTPIHCGSGSTQEATPRPKFDGPPKPPPQKPPDSCLLGARCRQEPALPPPGGRCVGTRRAGRTAAGTRGARPWAAIGVTQGVSQSPQCLGATPRDSRVPGLTRGQRCPLRAPSDLLGSPG